MLYKNNTLDPIQQLTIDSQYTNSTNISFDKLLFLLHYLIIIPMIMLCFVFCMRFLRNRGILSLRESEEMIEDIKDFRLISTPLYNDTKV